MSWNRGLRFLSGRLSCPNADLRVSLREVRRGQRNPGPFQQMERDQMPELRIGEAFQAVICVRLLRRRQPAQRQAVVQGRRFLRPRFLRQWRLLWRREAPALSRLKQPLPGR